MNKTKYGSVVATKHFSSLKKQPRKAAKKFNRSGIITQNPEKCETW